MRLSLVKSIATSILFFTFISSSYADVLPKKSALPLQISQQMVNAAVSHAEKMNLKISVAVLDSSGHLKAFARMDGARTGSIDVAQLKAGTSARFEVSSRKLAENNLANPNHPYSKFPNVILLAGGLPLTMSSGEHIGAIGVSGASADQDEECAQAGINKMNELLQTQSRF